MSAPVYVERIKENGEAYIFSLYHDSEGARVEVSDACGDILCTKNLSGKDDKILIEKARDFCENFTISREDRINYRSLAC
jgi:hypothetical protein